ncbi:hypothetical protein SAMN05444000_102100 [Shimia gijangensis]|uniref:Uncharacterized protein n=1 Tax=Shimia gijangensis TaxID=1470563 RepID=A0A1M6CN45_9RHOB|nr:hypothetical protein SAMN05444000_102100 [Shimia gijangensis]
MLQAAVFDCQFLDLLSLSQDSFVATEADIGRCDVVQAFMVALVVIVGEECADLTFKIAGQFRPPYWPEGTVIFII